MHELELRHALVSRAHETSWVTAYTEDDGADDERDEMIDNDPDGRWWQ